MADRAFKPIAGLYVVTGNFMPNHAFDPTKDCCPCPHPCNCNGDCATGKPFIERDNYDIYDAYGQRIG